MIFFGIFFLKALNSGKFNIRNKFFCNLKGVASSQLQKHGVKNVIDCNQCTYENENYHSYRRDKTSKRMTGLIYYE